MSIKANDLVWIGKKPHRKLAIVVGRRQHAALVRLYNSQQNTFSNYLETVALSTITKANLLPEQYNTIACGKKILSKTTAFRLVAVNYVFTDIPFRRERRVYYCTRCRGYHTTSQRWMPPEILARLKKNPFPQYIIKKNIKVIHNYRDMHRWLRDDIGLRIDQRTFIKTLRQFEPDPSTAVKKLLDTPADYLEFMFYEIFRFRDRTEVRRAVDGDKTAT